MTVTLDSKVESKATALTRARYERIAPVYDRVEAVMERLLRPWRVRLWSEVKGPKVLEVGVGTGKNIPYYPPGVEITAIDLTPGMLAQARERARRLGAAVDLCLGDVQALDFPDHSFDDVVATCVFCSVPDPLLGLRELARVVRPGGTIHLLEHVRPTHSLLAWLMDVMNPLVVRIMGSNMNRRTVETARRSGLLLRRVEDLDGLGILKLIVAHPGRPGRTWRERA